MRSRTPVKAVLLATMAMGGLAFFAVPGVWALFSAETRNVQASAATGTLTFSMKVGASGMPCHTKDGTANTNSSCDALFTYDTGTENYPGVVRTQRVTIANTGSLDASSLLLYAPSGCTNGATGDAPASVVGSGNACASGGFQIAVQETDASFTTAVKCYFPTTGTLCASSSLGINTFVANYTSAATALDVGPGPAAQQSRYFVIAMQVPSSATNTLQGRSASVALAWRMTS
jgi:hypothetical protein